MAITSRDLHPPAQLQVARARRFPQRQQMMPYMRLGLGMLLALLVLFVLSGRAAILRDDLRYGRPRTQQLDGMVGHNETAGEPTHFIAMNLNRHVVVIELPGGDINKAQTLQGPYLFGANEDLTPVGLRLQDVNHDGKNDLIVAVKREEIIYINTGTSFRLITAAERGQLTKAP